MNNDSTGSQAAWLNVTQEQEALTQTSGWRTALVIEDDAVSARLACSLLEAEGFHVVVAMSGEEAILLAPQQPLSLITLDIGLPGIDGWTCLKRLRDESAVVGVPVVVIAGLAYTRMGVTQGVDAVIQKPLRRAELAATLESLGLHPEKPSQATILIVDDPVASDLIAMHLPVADFNVIQAFEVGEALTLTRREQPKLILVDLMTPDLAGLALIRALAADPTTSAIPVLVITARRLSDNEKSNLGDAGSRIIRVVDKTGLTPTVFMSEVKNALV